MKRILSIIIIISLLGTVSLFSSCGDNKHNHNYGDWNIEKAATCTETGIRTRKCSCGDVQSETTPARGHNYVDGVCTICGIHE